MNRSSQRHRRRKKRTLKLQSLETRQLLAAEFGDTQNPDMPEDVNADGIVSSMDALMVINRLGGRRGDDPNTRVAFRDVNGDGDVTSLDALRIVIAWVGARWWRSFARRTATTTHGPC